MGSPFPGLPIFKCGETIFYEVRTMDIKEVKEGKKQYLPLLLLADEQEDMIDRYLTNGTMYVFRG